MEQPKSRKQEIAEHPEGWAVRGLVQKDGKSYDVTVNGFPNDSLEFFLVHHGFDYVLPWEKNNLEISGLRIVSAKYIPGSRSVINFSTEPA